MQGKMINCADRQRFLLTLYLKSIQRTAKAEGFSMHHLTGSIRETVLELIKP
jgi:hypothetical protein